MLYRLGTLQVEAGDYQGAYDTFKRLIERYPRSGLKAAALAMLGFVEQEQGQYEEAIRWYEQVRAERPDDVVSQWALLELGRCYEAVGDIDKARRAYEEAAGGFLGDEASEQLTLLELKSRYGVLHAGDEGAPLDEG